MEDQRIDELLQEWGRTRAIDPPWNDVEDRALRARMAKAVGSETRPPRPIFNRRWFPIALAASVLLLGLLLFDRRGSSPPGDYGGVVFRLALLDDAGRHLGTDRSADAQPEPAGLVVRVNPREEAFVRIGAYGPRGQLRWLDEVRCAAQETDLGPYSLDEVRAEGGGSQVHVLVVASERRLRGDLSAVVPPVLTATDAAQRSEQLDEAALRLEELYHCEAQIRSFSLESQP